MEQTFLKISFLYKTGRFLKIFYLKNRLEIFLKKLLTNLENRCRLNSVGVDDAEGTPVPIPNTVVKLSGAENTWLATVWEDREMPTFFI